MRFLNRVRKQTKASLKGPRDVLVQIDVFLFQILHVFLLGFYCVCIVYIYITISNNGQISLQIIFQKK